MINNLNTKDLQGNLKRNEENWRSLLEEDSTGCH